MVLPTNNLNKEQEDQRYIYQIAFSAVGGTKENYILQGFKFQHIGAVNMIHVYESYFFMKAASCFNLHIARPLCIDYAIDLSLIHICRCRRYAVCRSRWSPYH
eukprot:TRINITY_DN4634_c0_g1_i1.p1 TRINITY_DN4634_c0_g1~~TRINITY_DN4634_c0_g1_i1.p1  ORF type:complete len:103 (-),score=15.65 TRINITY_DN4634_c0_g1_i1:13-321(-)